MVDESPNTLKNPASVSYTSEETCHRANKAAQKIISQQLMGNVEKNKEGEREKKFSSYQHTDQSIFKMNPFLGICSQITHLTHLFWF